MGLDSPISHPAPVAGTGVGPAQGSCLLVTTALAHWPDAVTSGLASLPPLGIDELSDEAFEASELVLLGYTDPARGLAELLQSDDEPQVLASLEQWRLGGQRMLELRSRRAQGCLLINLSRLDAAAEAELLRLAGRSEASAPETPPPTPAQQNPAPELAAASPSPDLPKVVEFHLSQRSDLNALYADLEGCADLFGREPEFTGQAFSQARGLALSEQLLWEWIESRRQQNLQRAELLAQIAAVSQERDNVQAELGQLRQKISTQQSEQLELERQRRRADEAEARLSDAFDNHELTMLQKQQLEEELSHSFQLQQQTNRRCEEMAERLAALEHECRHLFLNSPLGEGTDRRQIQTLLELMRRSLLS